MPSLIRPPQKKVQKNCPFSPSSFQATLLSEVKDGATLTCPAPVLLASSFPSGEAVRETLARAGRSLAGSHVGVFLGRDSKKLVSMASLSFLMHFSSAATIRIYNAFDSVCNIVLQNAHKIYVKRGILVLEYSNGLLNRMVSTSDLNAMFSIPIARYWNPSSPLPSQESLSLSLECVTLLQHRGVRSIAVNDTETVAEIDAAAAMNAYMRTVSVSLQ